MKKRLAAYPCSATPSPETARNPSDRAADVAPEARSEPMANASGAALTAAPGCGHAGAPEAFDT